MNESVARFPDKGNERKIKLPEPHNEKKIAPPKITIVGMGPGAKEYVLPKALETVQNARVLIGGRRLLADFARNDQKTFPITSDLPAVLCFLRENLPKNDVTIMVAGDPGYYSLLDTLRREFPAEYIETIPGISSLQFAFAKLNLPWHDAVLASFHGREPAKAQLAFVPGKILGLLTDGERNSQTIAARLINDGWPPGTVLFVLERLSYPDEKIHKTTVEQATKDVPIKHCILIVVGQTAANG